ncbi:hypothetical protein [Flavobacterium chilense]|uniref:Uncharacterized protein n=1 Tax=Flavobacterium chilense TaxID=946677 RepID=A0A1M6ZVJ7_9FLAO|nr:hypothetical protein [Flavobacterium chilense]SHL34460.1 hypothetical protein SAMN05444484_1011173 [Flavobacterium chilense]
MKRIFTLTLAFIACSMTAQTKLLPGDKTIETKWIKSEKYAMNWYAMKDTAKFEIAKIITTVNPTKKDLTIITDVEIKNAKVKWVDSTIVAMPSLAPVYHSSFNMQRDIVLKYGKTVTGYHTAKGKEKENISETLTDPCFDSSFYPYLLRLLPLKEGYTKEIAIFDYNPQKTGLFTASVKSVKSDTCKTKKGKLEVWAVTVADEIGGSATNTVTYYIGKTDRKLWKQEFSARGQHFVMEVSEL